MQTMNQSSSNKRFNKTDEVCHCQYHILYDLMVFFVRNLLIIIDNLSCFAALDEDKACVYSSRL
jgi:hypothetical protein